MLLRFVQKIESDAQRDERLGEIAFAYSRLGDKTAVTQFLTMFKGKEAKCEALLKCALVFPPETLPVSGKRLLDRWYVFDGGAGLF